MASLASGVFMTASWRFIRSSPSKLTNSPGNAHVKKTPATTATARIDKSRDDRIGRPFGLAPSCLYIRRELVFDRSSPQREPDFSYEQQLGPQQLFGFVARMKALINFPSTS